MADVDVPAITMAVLRVICLLAFAASISILIMDDYFTNIQGKTITITTTTIKNIVPYRYLLSMAIMWAAYSLIRHEFFQELDFFGDKVFCSLLASTGLAYSFKLKGVVERLLVVIRSIEAVFPENDKQLFLNLLDREIFATGLLAVGFACMAIVSIYSSIARSSARRFWR